MNENTLSAFQHKVLAVLRAKGPTPFTDLCQVMAVPAGALARSLGVLESSGLVGQSGMPARWVAIAQVPSAGQTPTPDPTVAHICPHCKRGFRNAAGLAGHVKATHRELADPDPPGQIVQVAAADGNLAGETGIDRETVRDWLDRLVRSAAELREVLFGPGGGGVK